MRYERKIIREYLTSCCVSTSWLTYFSDIFCQRCQTYCAVVSMRRKTLTRADKDTHKVVLLFGQWSLLCFLCGSCLWFKAKTTSNNNLTGLVMMRSFIEMLLNLKYQFVFNLMLWGFSCGCGCGSSHSATENHSVWSLVVQNTLFGLFVSHICSWRAHCALQRWIVTFLQCK